MIITDVEIRACTQHDSLLTTDTFRDGGSGAKDGMDFLVITLKTDVGIEASSFGFAGRSALGSAALAEASMKSFLIGRDPFDRAAIWQQFRTNDRWWNHLPIYSLGPFDIALWVLCAKASNVPLYKFIGACRDEVPAYCSSLVLAKVEDYAEEALRVKAQGYRAYKVHPPGRNYEEDLEVHRRVREAVGPDFSLMSDPVASLTLMEAIRFAKELEKLDYLWLEEPFFDENIHTLRELRDKVNIPIVAAEVVAKHPYSVTEYITSRAVDAVRADVSWSGGVTGVLKTAALAEAFNLNCELHSTIMHPLELVNLHCAAAVPNNSFFELLTSENLFDFGLSEPICIENGIAKLPEGAGLGIEFDWDFIETCTTQVF